MAELFQLTQENITENRCISRNNFFRSLFDHLGESHGEIEAPGYLTEQLITYIGNKRALIGEIDNAVKIVKKRLNKNKIRILDAFSGSGVVSRYFKRHASYLAAIDLEDYAATIARCYLKNKSEVNFELLTEIIEDLNTTVDFFNGPMGFIEELYSPKNEKDIKPTDRVFYTKTNARRIDNYRRMIDQKPAEFKDLLLGPLLSEASVHANTSGVFKGFYKNRHTGIGQFGGTNGDALKRICGKIQLQPPILSNFECNIEVYQGDANTLAPQIKNLDLVYLDPPYNQHPYGSNYFMLNLIVNYKRPEKISEVSGIPFDWRRSNYNVRSKAYETFKKLVESIDTKYILVSFNNEGFISREDIVSMLSKIGEVEVIDIRYNTFRGCRNLRNRNIHVTEQLFLVACY